jgi:hypothetical protein
LLLFLLAAAVVALPLLICALAIFTLLLLLLGAPAITSLPLLVGALAIFTLLLLLLGAATVILLPLLVGALAIFALLLFLLGAAAVAFLPLLLRAQAILALPLLLFGPWPLLAFSALLPISLLPVRFLTFATLPFTWILRVSFISAFLGLRRRPSLLRNGRRDRRKDQGCTGDR